MGKEIFLKKNNSNGKEISVDIRHVNVDIDKTERHPCGSDGCVSGRVTKHSFDIVCHHRRILFCIIIFFLNLFKKKYSFFCSRLYIYAIIRQPSRFFGAESCISLFHMV